MCPAVAPPDIGVSQTHVTRPVALNPVRPIEWQRCRTPSLGYLGGNAFWPFHGKSCKKHANPTARDSRPENKGLSILRQSKQGHLCIQFNQL